MHREAMKLALEALERGRPQIVGVLVQEDQDTAITALRQAIEQVEQEPFEYWNAVEGWVKIDEVREHFDSVGCGTIYKSAGEGRVPLFTAPPPRKPLTDEEIEAISAEIERSDFFDCVISFARAIEAAHGIKEEA